jgi:LysM repeat protein
MSTEQRILIYALIILMGYSLFNTNGISTDVKKYKNEILGIEQKIDSVNILNKQLDSKITGLHSQLELIDLDITNVEANLISIQKQTKKQQEIIETYSTNELQQFFIDRYGEKVTKGVLEEQVRINKSINYKVQSGNTLYSIAKTYNTSIAQIKKLNKINNNSIQKGQLLVIPQ